MICDVLNLFLLRFATNILKNVMKKKSVTSLAIALFILGCAKTSSYRNSSTEDSQRSQEIIDGKARADSATQIRIKPRINNNTLIKPPSNKGKGKGKG